MLRSCLKASKAFLCWPLDQLSSSRSVFSHPNLWQNYFNNILHVWLSDILGILDEKWRLERFAWMWGLLVKVSVQTYLHTIRPSLLCCTCHLATNLPKKKVRKKDRKRNIAARLNLITIRRSTLQPGVGRVLPAWLFLTAVRQSGV